MKLYLYKRWPLVAPFVDSGDYHEAIFRFGKWYNTFGIKPFLEELDCSRVLYILIKNRDLKNLLLPMLYKWNNIKYPKNSSRCGTTMLWICEIDIERSSEYSKYYTGTSEERATAYKKIIHMIIHEHNSFSL